MWGLIVLAVLPRNNADIVPSHGLNEPILRNCSNKSGYKIVYSVFFAFT